MKGEMTVKELKQHGFVYFEDGLWRRDVLLWRDCCGSVIEYADGTSGLCLAAKKTGRGKVTVEDADEVSLTSRGRPFSTCSGSSSTRRRS